MAGSRFTNVSCGFSVLISTHHSIAHFHSLAHRYCRTPPSFYPNPRLTVSLRRLYCAFFSTSSLFLPVTPTPFLMPVPPFLSLLVLFRRLLQLNLSFVVIGYSRSRHSYPLFRFLALLLYKTLDNGGVAVHSARSSVHSELFCLVRRTFDAWITYAPIEFCSQNAFFFRSQSNLWQLQLGAGFSLLVGALA